ncbi:hypothetical protein COT75_04490 [Candidatus Beckwithbacteria bacterium CG10_big_fil_rev_8_21_14_0_10_34_10]|uniref:Uncharacterized protein n=1 Tax=Candidatus Beckwithbacteria bacterium CG10_big_fil_rev_8_21_14_0_10_34_10 TaxID=1974495 RepID=A0A2H0W8H0_9BACT|nr:MAG: hypothetical protein COT75_04490 [Candidatus Beckwithbacteria bacterium CG10_big_fil_rev_8_21_14_0_10_34_10]
MNPAEKKEKPTAWEKLNEFQLTQAEALLTNFGLTPESADLVSRELVAMEILRPALKADAKNPNQPINPEP